MCVFSYPHLYRRHSCCTSDACLSFRSPILSHFPPLWHSCSLQCGYTYTHFSCHTGAKSHVHTLSCTHNGRSARTQPNLRTYRLLPLYRSGSLCMGRHACRLSQITTDLLSVDLIMKVTSLLPPASCFFVVCIGRNMSCPLARISVRLKTVGTRQF